MELKELENYTINGSVCVDIVVVDKYPGFVRKVVFYRQNRVCVEFVGYGVEEEQGYEFCNTFDSLEEAVTMIENYLNKPLADWTNFTKTGDYPSKPENADIIIGLKELLYEIVMREIYLPDNEKFKPRFKLL